MNGLIVKILIYISILDSYQIIQIINNRFNMMINYQQRIPKKMSNKKRIKRLDELIKNNYFSIEEQLYLPSEKLESEDIELIVQYDLQSLQKLKLSDNSIGLKGLTFLCQGQWSQLKRLELKCCKVGPKGVQQLIKGDWKFIEHIRLGFNQLGNEGLQYLARADWKYLIQLWLQGNFIGTEGIRYLKKANWKSLQCLSLWDNKVNMQGVKQICLMDNSLSKVHFSDEQIMGRQRNSMTEILNCKFPNIQIKY